ncbi:MAG: (Fe-S)-binding protein, partial [Thermodesulfobacteriota bacterium]|nr:(Fe-S)-binding protein [Thermodesulfobacteriota bacterium]
GEDDPYVQNFIWMCLTCGRCEERCPSYVTFSEFVRKLRARALRKGKDGFFSHGGILHTIMEVMSAPALKQNRTGWLTEDIKTSSYGDILYFVGCVPYFNVYFKNLELDLIKIPESAVKVLNHLGVEPVILENERCCGHDLYWAGKEDEFKKLVSECSKELMNKGIKEIVTSCPECLYTLKELYPTFVKDFNVKVTHIYDFIKGRLKKDDLNPLSAKVTYQDSCRLVRYVNMVELPRELINKFPETEFIEMPSSRSGSTCCGNSAWVGCGRHSKDIQLKRIDEAKSTGADLLITSCPKCLIHLQCTMKDIEEENRMPVKDMMEVIYGLL